MYYNIPYKPVATIYGLSIESLSYILGQTADTQCEIERHWHITGKSSRMQFGTVSIFSTKPFICLRLGNVFCRRLVH